MLLYFTCTCIFLYTYIVYIHCMKSHWYSVWKKPACITAVIYKELFLLFCLKFRSDIINVSYQFQQIHLNRNLLIRWAISSTILFLCHWQAWPDYDSFCYYYIHVPCDVCQTVHNCVLWYCQIYTNWFYLSVCDVSI